MLVDHKNALLEALRGRNQKLDLRDPVVAWEALVAVVASYDYRSKKRFERFIYCLALIYTDQTGLMPGYTNSDNETRFEHFACTVLEVVSPETTRSKLRTAVRRIDAKNNRVFAEDIEQFRLEGARMFANLCNSTGVKPTVATPASEN